MEHIDIHIDGTGLCQVETSLKGGTFHRTVPIEVVARMFVTNVGDDGFLPSGLFYRAARPSGELIALFVPPGKIDAVVQGHGSFTIPMPGLVFAGAGMRYYMIAIKDEWPHSGSSVFAAPLFNIRQDHSICPGNVAYEYCGMKTVKKAYGETMMASWDTSYRTAKSRKHPDDLLKQWKAIRRRRAYPAEDLVDQTCKLGEFLEGLR